MSVPADAFMVPGEVVEARAERGTDRMLVTIAMPKGTVWLGAGVTVTNVNGAMEATLADLTERLAP